MRKQKPILLTLNRASQAFNVERRTLERRLNAAGIGPRTSYTLEQIAKAMTGDYIAARTRVAQATATRIETENRRRSSELLEGSAVVAFLGELATRQKAILRQRLENEAPMAMAGVDTGSARVIAKRIVDEICREMEAAILETGGRTIG
ncbi:MAG: hypothetical protein JXQ71_13855 [Verrucomicrobia bacterium]|nr:hypothetical protein [Verrucomicrobiota bacterium]